jgi:hypothetical protein
MRRTKKSSIFSWVYKPAAVAILLLGVFGLVWLRSSVTSAAYSIRELEEKRTVTLKEMKTLLAERSKLMALSNIDFPGQGDAGQGKRLVSSGYVFPDRVRVIHVTRTKGPEAYKASYRTEKPD